jgi:DNA-directed RNA polymerase specialized sigma24 family protein
MPERTSSRIGRALAALSYGHTVRGSASDGSVIEPEAVANGLAVFVEVRPRLFAIAYRILGCAAAAEDVVQDAWLRWQAIDRSVVLNARAFLATTTMRLAINVAQSARLRRETCVGTWLAEPADTRPDPQTEVERGEALEHAVLMLLETLSPRERAAYVLREASITLIARSRASSSLRRRTLGNWSFVPGSASPTANLVRPAGRLNARGFSKFSSPPRRTETFLCWRSSS